MSKPLAESVEFYYEVTNIPPGLGFRPVKPRSDILYVVVHSDEGNQAAVRDEAELVKRVVEDELRDVGGIEGVEGPALGLSLADYTCFYIEVYGVKDLSTVAEALYDRLKSDVGSNAIELRLESRLAQESDEMRERIEEAINQVIESKDFRERVRSFRGRGRFKGNKAGAGPGGFCVCPECGKRIPHRVGRPCYNIRCPECGVKMIREGRNLNEKVGDLLALVGKKSDGDLTTTDAKAIGRKIARMPLARRKKYLAMVRALGGWYGGRGKGRATLDRLRKAILNAYNKAKKSESLEEARRAPQPGVTKDVVELARKWLASKRTLEELQKQVREVQKEFGSLSAQLEEILANLQDMQMRVDNVVLILEEVVRKGYTGPPQYSKVVKDLVKWCSNISEDLGRRAEEEVERLKKVYSKEVPPSVKRRIKVESRSPFTKLFTEADLLIKIKEVVSSLFGWTSKMRKDIARLERRAQFLKFRLQRV